MLELIVKNARGIAMFLLGAVAFSHEVVVIGTERPFVIAGALALMGLPFVLKGESDKKGD